MTSSVLRLLRWVVVCHCGRRCARLVARPYDEQPPGLILIAEYTCAGCGTRYRGNGWDRVRVK